jgi:hypothetical protein
MTTISSGALERASPVRRSRIERIARYRTEELIVWGCTGDSARGGAAVRLPVLFGAFLGELLKPTPPPRPAQVLKCKKLGKLLLVLLGDRSLPNAPKDWRTRILERLKRGLDINDTLTVGAIADIKLDRTAASRTEISFAVADERASCIRI